MGTQHSTRTAAFTAVLLFSAIAFFVVWLRNGEGTPRASSSGEAHANVTGLAQSSGLPSAVPEPQPIPAPAKAGTVNAGTPSANADDEAEQQRQQLESYRSSIKRIDSAVRESAHNGAEGHAVASAPSPHGKESMTHAAPAPLPQQN